MNASEDLKRLALAVRWSGRGVGAVFFVLFLVVAFASGKSSSMWDVSLIGLGLAALIVGETAALAWIIKGFVEPRE